MCHILINLTILIYHFDVQLVIPTLNFRFICAKIYRIISITKKDNKTLKENDFPQDIHIMTL